MAFTTIQQEGAFTHSVRTAINEMFQELYGGVLLSLGRIIYLNPAGGNDADIGDDPASAVRSLSRAYDLATAGNNDVVALIGDGSTTATARLSSGFTWAKNATHLVGISSGVNLSNRSRIAPTAAVTAFANFFTVSASGCLFSNIQWFHGFNTGTTAQICLTVSGGRNAFVGCHIAGMGDQTSADSSTSRSLKISTTGENQFVRCTIGVDTVTRGAANASVEFSGGAPRNEFINCVFPFMADEATPLGVIVSAAAGSDRFQLFDRCLFINAIKSTSTTLTALSTLAASIGGLHLYKDCTLVGITDFGSDGTSLAQIYVDGASVVAATSGIAVNPS
jgi:hypothetical protein